MKISVITVTFNSAKFINCCLSSVQNQTYKNIDHIVIDGASTDETLSILESNRDQLKVIISEPDKGVYDAMNKGIMISEGDIIGFLNSDDFYANNEVLSKVAKLFSKNPSLDGCYSDLIYTNQFNTKKNVRYWKSSKFVPGLFSKGWCPPHLTFFVRRAVYEKFSKFNLNYNIASDVELMMRFLEVHKINVQYIPEVWVKMRMGGLSNKNFLSIIKQNREILHALKKHKLLNNFFIFLIYKIISRMKQFINSK